jgi:hypothetical protein
MMMVDYPLLSTDTEADVLQMPGVGARGGF